MAAQHTKELTSLLAKLTLEEKVSLLAAVDWWRTPVIKRDEAFVPHIKVLSHAANDEQANLSFETSRQQMDPTALEGRAMSAESRQPASPAVQVSGRHSTETYSTMLAG